MPRASCASSDCYWTRELRAASSARGGRESAALPSDNLQTKFQRAQGDWYKWRILLFWSKDSEKWVKVSQFQRDWDLAKTPNNRKQWWTVFFGCLGLALMAWEALSNQLMHLLWILLSRYLSSYLYVVLVTAIITCSSSFSTYLVYISSLALLKMLKHGRAGVPMEVMGLMLGEFVVEYTGEVEICPLYPPIYSGLVLDNRLVSWIEIILLIFADLSLDIFT